MKFIATIVLYKPNINRVIENLKILAPQVDKILLINNDSSEVINSIKSVDDSLDFQFIENDGNFGIAAALNQALEYAKINKYDWLISLDQDSIVPQNMIKEYIESINVLTVGIVCPRIYDINNFREEIDRPKFELIQNEEDVITSGSCINIQAAIKVGGFDERLFIDFVDTEFQKRILLADYKIIRNNSVVLTHEIGNITEKKIFKYKILCTNHNSIRRFYQVRNRLYFKKKYYGNLSLLKEKVRLSLGLLKIIIFEDEKKEKCLATLKGFRDYKKLFIGDMVSRVMEKKMNISFVIPAFSGSGGINVVYEYANRLSQRGHKVTVFVPLIAYNMHRRNVCIDRIKQIYATCKVLKFVWIDKIPQKISNAKKIDVRAVWRIDNRYLHNADFVISTAWCTAFDVDKLNQEKGEKVYFIQDYEIWDNSTLGKKSYQLSLKKIVIAEWIKKKLIKECGCKGEEISIINNGIDIKKFSKATNNKYEKKDTIYCLILDHYLEKKGVKYGVEAFYKAKKINPNLKLRMFGIKKSKYVPENVEYYKNPSQDALVKLYQETDIFIFPSLEEGWGLTPIEAMACGCAVIGTNVGCMLDIGVDNANVVLCESANSDDLAKKIIELSENKNLRMKIAEEGYKTVQSLDWDNATEKFENILLSYKK